MSDQLSRTHLDAAISAMTCFEALSSLLSPNDDQQNILQHVDGHDLAFLIDTLTQHVQGLLKAAWQGGEA